MSILLQSLLNLQHLDDKLSEIKLKKKEIPAKVIMLENKFNEEKKKFEDQQQQAKDSSLRQKQLEKELQEGQEELKKKQSRLLAAKSNEEYRAIIKEIEFSQQSHSKIEDEILMLLEEIDTLKKETTEKQQSIEAAEKQLLVDKKTLKKNIITIDKEEKEQKFERKRICEEMQQDALAKYEKIRARRAGQAVVIIKKNVCPGCNLLIPPQTVNEVVQTEEIKLCPHCNRIMYCEFQEDL